MTELEKLIKEKEVLIKMKQDQILIMREQCVADRESLLNMKEQLLEEKLQATEMNQQTDNGLTFEFMKEQITKMSDSLLDEIKFQENNYRMAIDTEYDQKLEEAREEIRIREKSKYDRALGELREENQKLVRQLMSLKAGQ